jgi:hypothetical protein
VETYRNEVSDTSGLVLNLQVEIFKSCKWVKESLFTQALSIVSVMADEANVTVKDVLSYRSIQVRFKKLGERNIMQL